MRFIAPLRIQAREHAEPKQPQCVCGESIGKMSDASQKRKPALPHQPRTVASRWQRKKRHIFLWECWLAELLLSLRCSQKITVCTVSIPGTHRLFRYKGIKRRTVRRWR